MVRKKGKTVSFDAMIKFFMQNYDIPTKKDISKLADKIDRLENLIKELVVSGKKGRILTTGTARAKSQGITAFDKVFEIIKRFKNGIGITEIQSRTGFGDKKIRNIIFRLHKNGKIRRKSRGIYIAT